MGYAVAKSRDLMQVPCLKHADIPLVSLDVEKVKPMKWNKKAFDRLVLNSKTKELIYALDDVQTSKNKKMDDIIAGKGNGLIILLHGSPGTGKTLTAERYQYHSTNFRAHVNMLLHIVWQRLPKSHCIESLAVISVPRLRKSKNTYKPFCT
jgi:Cdc6-like AAA superfamily ATPase